MSDEENRQPEYHLREALRHLQEAQGGQLRQTNAVAIRKVSDTVARVLSEREQDE